MIDIIHDGLLILLPSVSQLTYANHVMCGVEAIQEFILHLPLTINESRSKVCIPIQYNAFKRSYKLLH